MKKFWKVSVLILVAGIMVGDLLLDYRTQVQAHPQDTEAAELLDVNVGIAVGDLAPDFTGTTVDGQAITLSELSGKLVVVNVFASWCGPCRAETPHLVEIYKQLDRDRVEFIGLNFQETPKTVESFKEEFSIDYPLVLDEGGGITDIYRPIGLHTTWFIDQDGNIRFSYSGPMTKESLQVILEDVEAGRDPDPFAVIG
ncbi:MAG: TlpA disulfide reductase family protein [Anaerolineales bacterium]